MRISVFIICIFSVIFSLSACAQEYILKKESYKNGPTSLNFSPDGQLLLAGFADGSFRVLDPVSFQPSLEVEAAHNKPVTAIDMPPKMDFIMTAGGNVIKIWDLTGKHIGNLNGHATTIWDAEISSNGLYAVSTAFNKTFLLWDVNNGAIVQKMQGHEDVTLAACFSPDNMLIASGSHDLSIRIWDLENPHLLHTLHGPTQEVLDVEISPDNRWLAVASRENSIRIYDLSDFSLAHILKGHRQTVRKIAFSPDSRLLVSASEDQNIVLWDVITADKIHVFVENDAALLDVEFHPDGESIFSASAGGELAHRNLDPELFVLRFFGEEYRNELDQDPLFGPRKKGETKKDFETREAKAAGKKALIAEKYYQRYLQERDHH
jgi:WD40 repeat protein